MLDMSTLQVPEGFLQPDESLEAMLDPDILVGLRPNPPSRISQSKT